MERNPKLLHRIYFTNYKPFYDPFEHYLESWTREMPDYKVMKWGIDNLDIEENEWTRTAAKSNSPVFLSEYFRWKVLAEYGGLYLDADCEVINGQILSRLVDDLYASDRYDVFFGVEEKQNGHPTAQTFAAKKNAAVVDYMRSLYTDRLEPLWPWRETRGLIGPQLLALYYLNKGINRKDDGFFKNIDDPLVIERSMIYPQRYFSPKFSILGDAIDYSEGETCVYHMFANSNIDFSDRKNQHLAREQALTFEEYRAALAKAKTFPRRYDSSHFIAAGMSEQDNRLVAENPDGLLFYGPYFSIEPGRYSAMIDLLTTPRRGRATIRITADTGKRELGRASIDLASANALRAEFVVPASGATQVEVTLSMQARGRVEFTGIDVDQLSRPSAAPRNKLKTLHRIYFGFDGKPDPFTRYLETWQQELADFDIVNWDASNLPMDINPYVRQLYAERDHAFLTDFFRWYVLREYGGVYFDADIEVVNGSTFRKIVEELEYSAGYDAFIGIDEKRGGWYTAHSMASRPNSEISRFMCELYANFGSFTAWRKKGLYFWAPQLVGLYFANHGHHVEGMGTSPHLDAPIVTGGVKIYPQDWFSPMAPTGDPEAPFVLNGLSENTCVCHHFACSWHDAGSAYLAYSQKQGGHAQAVLRDIIRQKEKRTYAVTDGALRTIVGSSRSNGFAAAGKAGRLVYGPYVSLAKGWYRVSFTLSEVKRLGPLTIDIAADCGQRLLGERRLDLRERPSQVSVDIEVPEPANEVEFRMSVSRKAHFVVTDVTVETL